MQLPILTYHSMKIHGCEYANNDLVALAADLEEIHRCGYRIVPLRTVIDTWLTRPSFAGDDKMVALSCDDGGDFDFFDLPHPTAGPQRSVLNSLRDFRARNPGAGAHITSFVIASPEARRELDRTCMIGKGWWTDSWWRDAIASGLMHIGNHSWDHNHDTLPERFRHGVASGTFSSISTQRLADLEIRCARDFLCEGAPNPGNALFAYPYGESNDYLTGDYFPRFAGELGIVAAFTDCPGYLGPESHRWKIPRFMFGRDWRSSEQLRDILRGEAAIPSSARDGALGLPRRHQ